MRTQKRGGKADGREEKTFTTKNWQNKEDKRKHIPDLEAHADDNSQREGAEIILKEGGMRMGKEAEVDFSRQKWRKEGPILTLK